MEPYAIPAFSIITISEHTTKITCPSHRECLRVCRQCENTEDNGLCYLVCQLCTYTCVCYKRDCAAITVATEPVGE